MTLTATIRPPGDSPRNTCPIPPAPRRLSRRYPPTLPRSPGVPESTGPIHPTPAAQDTSGRPPPNQEHLHIQHPSPSRDQSGSDHEETSPGNSSASCCGYSAISRSSSSVSGFPVADAHSWTSENTRSSAPAATSTASPSNTCRNPALPPYSPVSTTRPARAYHSAGNGPSTESSYNS